jgi:structure-specific endonuclease subunit SLX1
MKENASWIVYCLATVEEPIYTYIGATPYPEQRLRQHNGELSGGARATSNRPGQWYRVCLVKGFLDNCDALSFEWHWKYFSRKNKRITNPLERRQQALEDCLLWYSKKNYTNTLEIDWS